MFRGYIAPVREDAYKVDWDLCTAYNLHRDVYVDWPYVLDIDDLKEQIIRWTSWLSHSSDEQALSDLKAVELIYKQRTSPVWKLLYDI